MAAVNYVQHVEGVLMAFNEDDRITPWHISLYFALFSIWNNTRFKKEINIRREELMLSSKIGSVNTYTKCLRELNEWGYIVYTPSKSRFKSSKVHMLIFDNTRDTSFDNTRDTSFDNTRDTSCDNTGDTSCDNSSDNSNEHLVRPFLNNNKHIINNNKHNKTIEDKNKFLPTSTTKKITENNLSFDDTSKGEIHSSNQKSKTTITSSKFKPPSLSEAKSYFIEKKSSFQHAEMFFNHFESNGWKVGGKSPMKNWKAAARNWIIRAEEYQISKMSPTQQRLHVAQQKDYSEPL